MSLNKELTSSIAYRWALIIEKIIPKFYTNILCFNIIFITYSRHLLEWPMILVPLSLHSEEQMNTGGLSYRIKFTFYGTLGSQLYRHH